MLEALKTAFSYLHSSRLHPAPVAPVPEPPTEEKYIALIQAAQKADHKIYSEEKLKNTAFGLNADLPGALKLITLPYSIVCTIVHITQECLKKVSVSLNESKYKLASQILNFFHAALVPIMYLSAAGLFVIEGCGLFVTANALVLCVSALEIASNAFAVYKHHQFFKTFNLKVLHQFSSLTSALTPQQLHIQLPKLIEALKNKDKSDQVDYQAQAIEQLQQLHTQLLSNPEQFTDIRIQIAEIFSSFKKEFVTHKMHTLEKQFFALNDQEKASIINKCRKYYKHCDYPEALHHGFSLVQDTFKEKKILLGKRVQPWLALQMTNSYKNIIEQLSSASESECLKGIDEGIALLERACYNSSLKKSVAITNIILFSLISAYAILSLLSLTNPVSAVISIILTPVIYYFNSFRIRAILNSRTYDIDWKNCCPMWLRNGASKIHSWLFKKQEAAPIQAHVVEIPRPILQTPPSTPLTPEPPQKSYLDSLKDFYSDLRACL